MNIKIALAGNPNSGKTTLFNALTGSNQYVGNWPGVTVEKKEGNYKENQNVIITDLPGIYSLSPYSLEEIVSRNYLLDECPDLILNVVDGTNLERNLYLTSQLMELGIPVILAVNMMDVVRKNGDVINITELSKRLSIPVCQISAIKQTGIKELMELALNTAQKTKNPQFCKFTGLVEKVLAKIEEDCLKKIPEEKRRWYSIKLFERDSKIMEKLGFTELKLNAIDREICQLEERLDDDSESIIVNERYNFIGNLLNGVLKKKDKNKLSISDKIDRIVTNRWLGLPIFACIMFLVYFVSVTTVGGLATDWANDGVFGDGWHLFGIGSNGYSQALENFEEAAAIMGQELEEPDPSEYGVWVPGIPVLVERFLDFMNVSQEGLGAGVRGLVLDGIIAGLGAVLGFVPQILILFIFLAFLEASGYMARVAFVLDRIFRKFGLSGKSFIPLLISSGCGVPGIMASRTIENQKDRRLTIMTTTFVPCSAKLPFIALISGSLFGGNPWIAPASYFIGIFSVICSGIILKRTKLFSGEVAPFVMELPSYHWPTLETILRSMWERAFSFIKKAGTIILLSTIIVWFTSFFGFTQEGFRMLEEEELNISILARIGNLISWIFIPLGFGNWQATVASITGLVAKENIVGTLGILYGGGSEASVYENMALAFSANGMGLSGFSFLMFNLLCAPCFAAMGAIKREMNSTKWFWIAIGYQCSYAYIVALLVYRIGRLVTGGDFMGTCVVIAILILLVFFVIRSLVKNKKNGKSSCSCGCSSCFESCGTKDNNLNKN